MGREQLGNNRFAGAGDDNFFADGDPMDFSSNFTVIKLTEKDQKEIDDEVKNKSTDEKGAYILSKTYLVTRMMEKVNKKCEDNPTGKTMEEIVAEAKKEMGGGPEAESLWLLAKLILNY